MLGQAKSQKDSTVPPLYPCFLPSPQALVGTRMGSLYDPQKQDNEVRAAVASRSG